MSAPEDICLSSPQNASRPRHTASGRSRGCPAAGDHELALAVETSCCGGAPVATTDQKTLAVETPCCGEAPVTTTDEHGQEVFGAKLYGPDATQGAPDAAVAASLGCGVPTAVADLHPGEVVLDLGSGAGAGAEIEYHLAGVQVRDRGRYTAAEGCRDGAVGSTFSLMSVELGTEYLPALLISRGHRCPAAARSDDLEGLLTGRGNRRPAAARSLSRMGLRLVRARRPGRGVGVPLADALTDVLS